MSEYSSKSVFRPEFPLLLTEVSRFLSAYQGGLSALKAFLDSEGSQKSEFEPFLVFIQDGLKEMETGAEFIRITENVLKREMKFYESINQGLV